MSAVSDKALQEYTAPDPCEWESAIYEQERRPPRDVDVVFCELSDTIWFRVECDHGSDHCSGLNRL